MKWLQTGRPPKPGHSKKVCPDPATGELCWVCVQKAHKRLYRDPAYRRYLNSTNAELFSLLRLQSEYMHSRRREKFWLSS